MPTLVEKLATAITRMDTVLKVKGDEYAYLRILDLANALRDDLLKAGILVIPRDDWSRVTAVESPITDRPWTSAEVRTTFTITDGIQELKSVGHGFARDLDGKAVAIAQTAALKSFLKRLTLTFGDLDDPEKAVDEGYNLRVDEAEKQWGPDVREWPITRTEVIAFNSACAASGHTKKGIAVYLAANFDIDKPSDLKRKQLAEAMAWALATGDKGEQTGTQA
jgi:hypothetical protein